MAPLKSHGLSSMLKEGHRHISGLDEVILKNIEACKGLSDITNTCLGPNGRNKLVIKHLDKVLVTNDADTIKSEVHVVQRPVAKILILDGKAQQEEIGDGPNLTISFA